MMYNKNCRLKTRLNFPLIFVSGLLLIISTASAQDGSAEAPAQDPKIGFVNIPKIMDDAQQAKAARSRLRDEFSDTKDELEECNEDVQKLENVLRREGEDMLKSRRERMIDTLKQKSRECGEIQKELNEEFNEERGKELGKLQKLIYDVVKELAEEKGIKLVVGPPVIYYDEAVDLTDEVLEELSGRK